MSQIQKKFTSISPVDPTIQPYITIPDPCPIVEASGYFRKTGRLGSHADIIENVDGSATFRCTGIHNSQSSQIPMLGYISRFFIEPDANGELEFITRVSGINLGTAGGNGGDALMVGSGIYSAHRFMVSGIGRDGFTNPNPRNMDVYITTTDFHLAPPSVVKGADRIALTSWDIKHSFNAADLVLNGCLYRTTYLSLDGGAYADITLATERRNKHVAAYGLRVIIGIFMNRRLDNFAGTVNSFRLIKGFAMAELH